MKIEVATLTIIILAFGCNEVPKDESRADTKVPTTDSTQTEIDANKKSIKDNNEGQTENKVEKERINPTAILDFTGTEEVEVTMNEIEILDSDFYYQLDSLIKWEKQCFKSTLSGLHWKFHSLIDGTGTFELTAGSDFGGKYLGFTYIDKSLVVLAPELPDAYKVTNKKGEFKFINEKIPVPTDYSVWIFKMSSKKFNIIKSYTLPCD